MPLWGGSEQPVIDCRKNVATAYDLSESIEMVPIGVFVDFDDSRSPPLGLGSSISIMMQPAKKIRSAYFSKYFLERSPTFNDGVLFVLCEIEIAKAQGKLIPS